MTQQEAIDYAKQQQEAVKQSQQYLIDQQNQQEQAQKQALEAQRTSAIGKLEDSKTGINQNALGLSKQENVSRVLGTRSLQQDLTRRGLGSSGVRETALGGLEASYGENINKIAMDKLNALRGVDSSIRDTNLTYDTNIANLLAEEAKKRQGIQQGIDQMALNQYNTAYGQYTSWLQEQERLKQQQLDNEFRERQYQESLKSVATSKAKSGKSSSASIPSFTDGVVQSAPQNTAQMGEAAKLLRQVILNSVNR